MTPAETDLAKLLVTKPWWVWMDGMQPVSDAGIEARIGEWGNYSDGGWRLSQGRSDQWPNLADPATCGCLEDMLPLPLSITRLEGCDTSIHAGSLLRLFWGKGPQHRSMGLALGKMLLQVKR